MERNILKEPDKIYSLADFREGVDCTMENLAEAEMFNKILFRILGIMDLEI